MAERKKSSRIKQGTAAGALAIALVAGFEGLRQNAYQDPVGVWTICYGHIDGVRRGDRKSVAECKALLVSELSEYAAGVESCVRVPIPDTRLVALTSFAYNVGVAGACRSSVVRFINQGRTRDGCDALMRWNKAGGITFPGLTRRRAEERKLCLEGV